MDLSEQRRTGTRIFSSYQEGEAFQTEAVSKRAYGTLWHTDIKNDDFKFTDGIPQGFDLEILASFNNVKKVVLVMIGAWVTTFCIREFYCS